LRVEGGLRDVEGKGEEIMGLVPHVLKRGCTCAPNQQPQSTHQNKTLT